MSRLVVELVFVVQEVASAMRCTSSIKTNELISTDYASFTGIKYYPTLKIVIRPVVCKYPSE